MLFKSDSKHSIYLLGMQGLNEALKTALVEIIVPSWTDIQNMHLQGHKSMCEVCVLHTIDIPCIFQINI